MNTLPKILPLSLLEEITGTFSSERVMGKGAFGTVYKGNLPEGGCIAVKKLVDEDTYDRQFQNEIGHLMTYHHENIVKIVGYCHESRKKVVQQDGRYIIVDSVERIICHEYLPMGSLDNYIFVETHTLDWHKRFEIIKGICKGLRFLHKEMDRPTVHMNLQPANIWLDGNMVPKITDFGYSRTFGADQTRIITQNIRAGVLGYMAPEFLYRGEISTMSDIYSLGLMIIEITTQEKNYSDDRDQSARYFINNVHQTWRYEHIASKYSTLDACSLQEVKKCIEIGLECVEADRNRRPSISEIVDRLYGRRAA